MKRETLSFSNRALAWAAIAGASLLAACSEPTPPAEPVRAVKVLTVGASEWTSGREFSGMVQARVESRLGFRVGGKITRRLVDAGQRVKAGQVLAQLDPSDYQLASDAARAQVTAARTQRDLAAADLKRFQSLKEQNFISGAELERRDATFRAAQATLDQAQAQLAEQSNQTGYTQLVADAAGVVTSVDAEVGQVVSAGTAVVHVAQDGAREVVFALPEDKLGSLPVGAPVRVQPWGGKEDIPATVREVAASADPVTRTYAVKVALPAQAALALGSTAIVRPQAPAQGLPPVIKLPTSALRLDGQATAVWVLDTASMTVRSQAVQVATADGNEAVIAAGLQPGQKVVVAGVHVLSPGQKVTIYQGPASPAGLPGTSAAASTPASAAR